MVTVVKKPNINKPTNIRELIDQQAGTHTDKVFLERTPGTSESPITFRQLQQESINIGAQLKHYPLSASNKVALMLPNHRDHAILFLALIYNGYVPVPINSTWSAADLAAVLKLSQPSLWVLQTQHPSPSKPSETNAPLLIKTLDEILHSAPNSITTTEPSTLPPISAHQDALIDFTSGSSGSPKGVVSSHANLLAGARNSIEAHQLSPADRCLCILPLYHMNAQVISLLATLMSGGSLMIPGAFQVAKFWHWVSEGQCSWFALVPSMVAQLTELTSTAPPDITSVRFARSSSAPLSPDLHQKFESKFDIPLIEAMGSTEAGGAIFSNPLPPAIRKIGSTGIPWGFEVKIADDQGNALVANQVGEILLKGSSVMTAYFNHAQASQEVFDPDGWLRTGDLAYLDEDGYCFVKGRIRELIIKSGENISPREIDETLMRHPAILEAAVTGLSHPILGEDIIAFVKTKDQTETKEISILNWCNEKLGLFKSPSRVFFVDDFPRGAADKILRSKLNQIAQSLIARDSVDTTALPPNNKSSVPPRTPIETSLHRIWLKSLPSELLGVQDHFFMHGGQSLTAMQVIAQIRHEFAIDLPLHLFFSHPTIESQALYLSEQLLAEFSDEEACQWLDEMEKTSLP